MEPGEYQTALGSTDRTLRRGKAYLTPDAQPVPSLYKKETIFPQLIGAVSDQASEDGEGNWRTSALNDGESLAYLPSLGRLEELVHEFAKSRFKSGTSRYASPQIASERGVEDHGAQWLFV